jgi:hypothetical protein
MGLYPPIMEPLELLEETKGPASAWPRKAARRHFEWFLTSIDERVSLLLDYFGQEEHSSPELLLDELGAKVAEVLPTDQFSYPEEGAGLDLTNQGYNVAHDLGLLVARLLLRNYPTLLRWELSPDRSGENQNLPVLVGWGKLQFEPAQTSIRLAKLVVKGMRSYKAWRHIYQHWAGFAQKAIDGLPLEMTLEELKNSEELREMGEGWSAHDPTARLPKTEVERLFQERDELLAGFERAAASQSKHIFDYSPESLKSLEAWYFEMFEGDSFGTIGATREQFERWMAVYLGAVLVKNVGYRWVGVEEPFERGRFALAVKKGLTTIHTTQITYLYKLKDNKRRQSVWKRYKEYATVPNYSKQS